MITYKFKRIHLCFLQDVEVPLHLLRYVCLFCGKNGLSLMKDCFEYGTPETLPFLIAHAFITVVSNVSIVWNYSLTFLA
jgi:ubiquitin carboxyl-terminal hydrolase 34